MSNKTDLIYEGMKFQTEDLFSFICSTEITTYQIIKIDRINEAIKIKSCNLSPLRLFLKTVDGYYQDGILSFKEFEKLQNIIFL